MSTEGQTSPASSGHDILARYLTAYARARQMADLERPWGLGDDALDGLWMRLIETLGRDPHRLDRLVAEELQEEDREHIAATLAPLLFALPLREYPAEVRAMRSGPRLELRLRRFARPGAENTPKPAGAAAPAALQVNKNWQEDALGFLPAALTASFAGYLRRALRFEAGAQRRVAVVSSGGRRRRVRVTLLAHHRGIVIRFLERLPSPADEGH